MTANQDVRNYTISIETNSVNRFDELLRASESLTSQAYLAAEEKLKSNISTMKTGKVKPTEADRTDRPRVVAYFLGKEVLITIESKTEELIIAFD